MTVNYMSAQKNDMFMQRYGFSSPVVTFLMNGIFYIFFVLYPEYLWAETYGNTH